jgi:hypothetical protein
LIWSRPAERTFLVLCMALRDACRFVVLQGEGKKKFEELTIELIGKYTDKVRTHCMMSA